MSRSNAIILFDLRAISIPADFIELMAHYLAREMENFGVQNYRQGMQDLYDMMVDILTGEPPLGENFFILNHLELNDDKTEFATLVNSTKSTISNIGDEISVTTLLAIEMQNKPDIGLRVLWRKPVKTKSLNKLLDATLKLVQDESFKGMWAIFEGWEDDFGGKANTELTIL